jgi:hypothetical protein
MNRLAASAALFVVMSSMANLASAVEPTKQQCVDANSAAQDLRRAGQLRQAREQLVLCVAASCPGPVREDCGQRLGEVDAAMPSIVFEAKDGKGNDVSAVRVTMDGQRLVDQLDGSALQVDPGEHRFTFADAGGFVYAERTIVMREGAKDHVRVELGASPGSQTPGVVREQPPAVSPSDGSTQRTIGLVLGGAGVVGLVIGGVFGLVSKGTYNNALQNECRGDPNGCTTQGAQDGQTAHSQATISTVGFIAGSALIAGGAALYFTAPKGGGVAVAPTVGTSGGGLSVTGAW